MLPPRHTPLAWFNLTHEKRRLLTAVAGVSFAVLLMFIFQGFENALYDSQVQLLKRLNGEILIVNRLKYNMFVPEQFARRRLYQAQNFEGVVAAYPFYTTTGDWKNSETKTIRPLRVIAFNPDDPVLPLPGILQNREALKLPWTALIDDQSRSEVGPIAPGTITELSEQQIRLVGTFSLGTDFASGNGNVVISDQNFLRYFANLAPEEDSRTLNTVDIGLLKVAENADVDAIASALRQQLPQDVAVWTKAEFVQKELSYWQENTAIGFVFSLLTTMGFFVGIILVYQILYTDVAEHWAEYATLKAIGYSNFHLLGIVLQESVILVFFGFVPGFFISLGLYSLTASSTGLLMQMTWERAINILIATFIMCLISGAIAVRKVQATDPAEVFGS
ncbi:ABC transporter permease DevC [Chroococcidiopsis thermalis]|uniref:DevC protein n=1 Tax=Chroococcidiopsis thermalis (strain PCC 7203) TaxID=251229 RepID=K9U1Y6_CHRTP|nr:ABC transporter permease DevC [Chroococcidiopsis thermalis]AFY88441.1 DevC protein [Chroococcidiopsis thermalis PCC 7203]